MNINVQSAFLFSQACCPAMAERGWGRVVNVTSWCVLSNAIRSFFKHSFRNFPFIVGSFSVGK